MQWSLLLHPVHTLDVDITVMQAHFFLKPWPELKSNRDSVRLSIIFMRMKAGKPGHLDFAYVV